MAFQSQSAGKNGQGWGCSCWTVQDLEADPTGNIVYAEGVVNIRHHGVLVSTQNLSNRGLTIVNGKKIWTPPFYRLEESQTCLNQMLRALITIGMQNGI